MTPSRTPSGPLPDDLGDTLIREIERCLETVELFRALDCEPVWQPDEGCTSRALALIELCVTRMTPV